MTTDTMDTDNMDIGALLADQLDRLLTDNVDAKALTESEQKGLSRSLWDRIDQLGISLALVPAERDGAGVGWGGSERAMRVMGFHAAPAPIGETMIAAELIAAAGGESPSGPVAVADETLALGGDGRISGKIAYLPWAGDADHILVTAAAGEDLHLCLVPASAAQSAPINSIGRITGAAVDFENAAPAWSAKIDADLHPKPRLAVLRSLQMAGALERCLELCVEYANTREQFGRPIGKFQAIQHQLSFMAEEVAAAQVAGGYGARCIDKGHAKWGAAVAKSRAGKSVAACNPIAHQVFGAIGVTHEHSLHYYTRRLWQWRTEAGSEHEWSEKLGRKVMPRGGDALWADICKI